MKPWGKNFGNQNENKCTHAKLETATAPCLKLSLRWGAQEEMTWESKPKNKRRQGQVTTCHGHVMGVRKILQILEKLGPLSLPDSQWQTTCKTMTQNKHEMIHPEMEKEAALIFIHTSVEWRGTTSFNGFSLSCQQPAHHLSMRKMQLTKRARQVPYLTLAASSFCKPYKCCQTHRPALHQGTSPPCNVKVSRNIPTCATAETQSSSKWWWSTSQSVDQPKVFDSPATHPVHHDPECHQWLRRHQTQKCPTWDKTLQGNTFQWTRSSQHAFFLSLLDLHRLRKLPHTMTQWFRLHDKLKDVHRRGTRSLSSG